MQRSAVFVMLTFAAGVLGVTFPDPFFQHFGEKFEEKKKAHPFGHHHKEPPAPPQPPIILTYFNAICTDGNSGEASLVYNHNATVNACEAYSKRTEENPCPNCQMIMDWQGIPMCHSQSQCIREAEMTAYCLQFGANYATL
ncbi:uncharacterized protein L3040_007840 [Drepanopeziza brunnea f. sp. 'multigermtubi']|uniref:uncharacterized protein n=1 Tax=Drepanopeziza brunnea f. sp. 'multigermtubi' TaxID=698441 RepID=UPI0023A4B733|nr:hypothetical protein L3040_007840 [Drepanopeziza brunnea f. sp. 'multigermtubi']